MLGILLAGGAATRLPNKPLLPMLNGAPVMHSSLSLFERSGIDTKMIVVPPGSPIPAILDRIDHHLGYCVQPEPTGVPHAVTYALDESVCDECIVVASCCDNIYSTKHVIEYIEQPYACVANDLPVWKRTQLSKVTTQGFVERGATTTCIIGWISAPARLWRTAKPGESTVHFLNRIQAGTRVISGEDWWDIGTQDMYTRYWTQ